MPLSDQRCLHHPLREAVARCPECRNTFCRECVTEHEDRVLCAACLKKSSLQPDARPFRWDRIVRVLPLLMGVVVAWLFFYWLGGVLLAIPSSFHEGTSWTSTGLPPE
jgi:hypothetical protein